MSTETMTGRQPNSSLKKPELIRAGVAGRDGGDENARLSQELADRARPAAVRVGGRPGRSASGIQRMHHEQLGGMGWQAAEGDRSSVDTAVFARPEIA
jgi:hypothetical protein